MTTRETQAGDRPALRRLYGKTFPGEDLTPLLNTLLAGNWGILSLCAVQGDAIAGHILFTRGGLTPEGRDGALLGPLAVHPYFEGQGIGTRLMTTAFDRLDHDGVRQIFVLGDPGYYHRIGFAPEATVTPPYPLPPEWAGAWQSRCLNDATPLGSGTFCLPPPWMEKALWQP